MNGFIRGIIGGFRRRWFLQHC